MSRTRRPNGAAHRDNAARLWVEVETSSVDALGFVQAQSQRRPREHMLFVPALAPPPGIVAGRIVFGEGEE